MIFAPPLILLPYDLKNFGNNNDDNDDDDAAAMIAGDHNNNNNTNTNNNNNNNNNYGTGLPHAQGYFDDDDRSTDEGMHRIKLGQFFVFFLFW
eukprot:CAMPEP_0170922694 /NCGR_PEP_ID=MMETSP0735-20130129/10600_1 /TAXON_ID=186038 /ORGANISM="Fragilariopsis kerguelensis, Strain L26-C5" /LENGTH=92 /DNA_ID=CAMNT_0011322151 /DNA_START=449 /DNA_END=724 /DNA_ORIENTATION=+